MRKNYNHYIYNFNSSSDHVHQLSVGASEKAQYGEWERSRLLNLQEDEMGILIEINEKRLYY